MVTNVLIIMLFVLNLYLWITKRFPVLLQMSQWSLVVLWTIHWAVGGYLAYPFLANVAGIGIILFWLGFSVFFIYRCTQYTKNMMPNR